MKLIKLRTENFRNLGNLDLTFDQDFIVLVGRNGVGKTSLLEAIYYTSLLLAFPPSRSWDLIAFDNDYFRIESETDEGQKLEYYYGKKGEKKYQRSQSVDGVKKRTQEFLSLVPCVSFLPQDLNLLTLSPSLRRDYLDEVLLQTEKGYADLLSDYNKNLSQRNELLKLVNEGSAQENELDFWDEKLFEAADKMVAVRTRFTEFVNKNLPKLYKETTGQSLDLSFIYVPSFSGGRSKREQEKSRQREIAAARTLWGPHRDDWTVVDGAGRQLSHFLSRGEQRSVMICLKLKELAFVKDALKKTPLLLLDELFSELDEERKEQIAKSLPEDTQIFLTTTETDTLPQILQKKAQVFELE